MTTTFRQRIKIAPKKRTLYQKYTLIHWGDTPYPQFAAPSPKQADEVYRRLMTAHGSRLRPAHITAPSLTVTGCGEVPQVLDAIVRTMLSANTTFEAAGAALQKLRRAAGTISEKQQLHATDQSKLSNCLDYMYILTSMTHEQLAEAISPAGGQHKTANCVLTILAEVWAMNKERAGAIQKMISGKVPTSDNFLAIDRLSDEEKQWEIRMFEKGILNLEFLKKLSPEDAMNKMLSWSGIGVKTAACVLLFCMQEDVLACDTHCVRLSKWLGWAPVEATDNLVFAHVDKRVPNHIKYGIHQLFIQHGKDCLRCQAQTNENTPLWDITFCPLEDLLDRGRITAYKIAQKAKATERKRVIASQTLPKTEAVSETANAEELDIDGVEAETEAEKAGQLKMEEFEEGLIKEQPKATTARRKIKISLRIMGKVVKPGVGNLGQQAAGKPEVQYVAKYNGPITRKRARQSKDHIDDNVDKAEVNYDNETQGCDDDKAGRATMKRARKRQGCDTGEVAKQPAVSVTTRRTRAQARLEAEKAEKSSQS